MSSHSPQEKNVEYRPDVIWKRKTSCHVFEIAFTEDWRAIAGEFTLAWLAGCSSFIVFRLADVMESSSEPSGIGIIMPETEEPFFKNLLGSLGEKFGMKWHFLQLLEEAYGTLKHIERLFWKRSKDGI